MKKAWLAFALSFVVPGAGLAYLGEWKWAVLNFALVQALLLGVILFEPGQDIMDRFHYILLVVAAASAGVAHALTLQANAKAFE